MRSLCYFTSILLLFSLGSWIPASAQLTDTTDAARIAVIKRLGGIVRPDNGGWDIDFHLRGRHLDDESLAQVVELKSITALNLKGTKVTDAGLAHLKSLPKLKRLHLEQTGIGDEGSKHLAQLHQLTYLNLFETKVTDRSLKHLAGLDKLERLYVWKTKVTERGAESLSAALPNIKVVRGVDLDNLPTFADLKADTPIPKEELKWIATANVSDVPKSQNGINTQVLFHNKSLKLVKLYWMSYAGELKHYADLQPGSTRQQNSYSKNSWLITDANMKPLGYFIVGMEVGRAVIPQ